MSQGAADAAKPVRAPGFDARKLPAWGSYHRTEDAPPPRLIEFSAPK